MSNHEGVPPERLRPVLEALRDVGRAMAKPEATEEEAMEVARVLRDACAAALASDAGTPEGEPEVCDSIRRGIADIESGRFVVIPAPLAESGAAAPPTNAPEMSTSLVDAALDRLIDEFRTDVTNGARLGDLHFWRHADESRAAIHAHVEKVKREAREEGRREGRDIQLKRAEECHVCRGSGRNLLARGLPCSACHGTGARPGPGVAEVEQFNRTVRVMSDAELSATNGMAPAPAPGDASGETDADFEAALDAYRDELMSHTRVGASGGLRALEPDRTELRRLYRAATGEVVGTATLYGGGKDGTSIGPGPDDELPELDDRESYRVDLVLRRDKEGV